MKYTCNPIKRTGLTVKCSDGQTRNVDQVLWDYIAETARMYYALVRIAEPGCQRSGESECFADDNPGSNPCFPCLAKRGLEDSDALYPALGTQAKTLEHAVEIAIVTLAEKAADAEWLANVMEPLRNTRDFCNYICRYTETL